MPNSKSNSIKKEQEAKRQRVDANKVIIDQIKESTSFYDFMQKTDARPLEKVISTGSKKRKLSEGNKEGTCFQYAFLGLFYCYAKSCLNDKKALDPKLLGFIRSLISAILQVKQGRARIKTENSFLEHISSAKELSESGAEPQDAILSKVAIVKEGFLFPENSQTFIAEFRELFPDAEIFLVDVFLNDESEIEDISGKEANHILLGALNKSGHLKFYDNGRVLAYDSLQGKNVNLHAVKADFLTEINTTNVDEFFSRLKPYDLTGLKKPGANVNGVVEGAACGGQGALVDRLLERGANVNKAVRDAAYNGHEALVNKLLERGANVNEAVWGAARGGQGALVDKLLERGANVNEAVRGAAYGGHEDLINKLLERGANVNAAVLSAARAGQGALVDRLLEQGANVNEAVRGAAHGGQGALVDTLLERGANVDTAVWGAAQGGHEALVNKLLEQGANVNEAVRGAAYGGHEALVNKLLERGANVNEAVLGAAQGGQGALVDKLLVGAKVVKGL